jgi:hypothetical protein
MNDPVVGREQVGYVVHDVIVKPRDAHVERIDFEPTAQSQADWMTPAMRLWRARLRTAVPLLPPP